ncbi:MAG: 3-oxoacyl-[acyl-carrier protein] reductase, partial [uncultured Rubrobacteraceae bacterium]
GPRVDGQIRPHNRWFRRHRPCDGPRLRRRRMRPAPRGEDGRQPPGGPGRHLARLRRAGHRPRRRPERRRERATAGRDLRRCGHPGQQRGRHTGREDRGDRRRPLARGLGPQGLRLRQHDARSLRGDEGPRAWRYRQRDRDRRRPEGRRLRGRPLGQLGHRDAHAGARRGEPRPRRAGRRGEPGRHVQRARHGVPAPPGREGTRRSRTLARAARAPAGWSRRDLGGRSGRDPVPRQPPRRLRERRGAHRRRRAELPVGRDL